MKIDTDNHDLLQATCIVGRVIVTTVSIFTPTTVRTIRNNQKDFSELTEIWNVAFEETFEYVEGKMCTGRYDTPGRVKRMWRDMKFAEKRYYEELNEL